MNINLFSLAQRKKNSAYSKHWEICVLAAPALLACGVLGTSYFIVQGHFSWSLTGFGVIAGFLLVGSNVLCLLERENEALLLLACVAFSYPLVDLLGLINTGLSGKGEMLYCLAGAATGFGAGLLLLDRVMKNTAKRRDAVLHHKPD